MNVVDAQSTEVQVRPEKVDKTEAMDVNIGGTKTTLEGKTEVLIWLRRSDRGPSWLDRQSQSNRQPGRSDRHLRTGIPWYWTTAYKTLLMEFCSCTSSQRPFLKISRREELQGGIQARRDRDHQGRR